MEIMISSGKIVEIIAYCLMSNHFHLLLKQKTENGITTYISNFTNAYTKYFNTRNERSGPLFQGIFKAVFIETDEQLLHLTRYIHLNPVVGSVIETTSLNKYLWSSYPSYLSSKQDTLTNPQPILSSFFSSTSYENFVLDQIDYAKKLDKIKHLTLE
jgi:putative transposase